MGDDDRPLQPRLSEEEPNEPQLSDPVSIPQVPDAPRDSEQPLKEQSNAQPRDKMLLLPPKPCFCLLMALVTVAILFQLGATVAQDWSHYGDGDQKRTYGLMRCDDCPPGVAGTNWYCPLEIECIDHPDSGLCNLAKDMYNSGNAYLVGQLPTFMLGVMLLERLLYAALGRDYGWPWVVYFLSGFWPICMLGSIVLWFASNDSNYQDSCDTIPANPNDSIDACSSDGGIVAIVATILTFIAGIVVAVSFCKRPAFTPPKGTGRRSCFGVPNWLVMILVLIFMLLVVSLYVAAPAHEDWIVTDGHKGGLLKMKRWGNYVNVGFDCIAEPRCAIDDHFGSCWTFRTLHQGSMVFMFFEVGAIYCWLLWFEAVCYYFIGREFGLPVMNYITPVLSVILHTVGTVVWLTRSQAKFEADCPLRPEHASERWDVCGKTGPILAIINIGIGFVAVGFFVAVYLFRHKDLGKTVPQRRKELELATKA